jgi:hypothetical protein
MVPSSTDDQKAAKDVRVRAHQRPGRASVSLTNGRASQMPLIRMRANDPPLLSGDGDRKLGGEITACWRDLQMG